MRIIFVENRHQTRIWERIARFLEQDGHQIGWIVQNAAFCPSIGRIFQIPYPSEGDKRPQPAEALFQRVRASDRNVNHFGGNTAHYAYYAAQIENILDEVHPDVVLGEATLFHELLCVEICKAKGILFLQPSCTRYPPKRFSFYLYDTLEPYLGSGEVLDAATALERATDIAERRIKPDYIRAKPSPLLRMAARGREFWKQTRVARSFWAGERYNSPSLFTKLRLERHLKQSKREWEQVAAQRSIPDGKQRLLYPMHMQPEANLDVWGSKYSNQPALIREIAGKIDPSCVLLIKPNPSSKYEMSSEMVATVASLKNVVPLSHNTTMDEIFPSVDVILTVTGTVAIEAILACKPVITLVKTLNNDNPGCVYLPDLDGLPRLLEMARQGHFPRNTDQHRAAFMQKLVSISYNGIVNDLPIEDRGRNDATVAAGFRQMLSSIGAAPFVAELRKAPMASKAYGSPKPQTVSP